MKKCSVEDCEAPGDYLTRGNIVVCHHHAKVYVHRKHQHDAQQRADALEALRHFQVGGGADGRAWLANLRRKYHHVLHGGTLTADDLARIVRDAERAQARIEHLERQLKGEK